MIKSYEDEVRIFKALCDENRLRILDYLRSGEKCACKLNEIVDVSQPTMSHHMKILCDAGIVAARKEGKWMRYSISEEGEKRIKDMVENLFEKNDVANESVNKDSETLGECACQSGEKRTKLYMLTGFLGAGKTTLLQKILETLKGKKVGIIQNELGKLGIDGTILRDDNIKMVELNRGSIFCSCLKLSFVQALAEMSAYDFDYLFVESSGFGDPSNVDEILGAAAQICVKQYDYSGTVCLVDAVNFFHQLDDMETVYRQLKHCHQAVITKVDLIGMEELTALKEKIREINPVCPISTSSQSDLYVEFLQDDLMKYVWTEGEETTNSIETKPKSLFMNFEGELEKEKLENFLKAIQGDVHRVKGFFKLKELGWHQIDVVGTLIDYKPCEPQEMSQLVFISRIGTAVIKKLFAEWEEHVGVPMQLKN